MSRFGVSYHDNSLSGDPEPIEIQLVKLQPGETLSDRIDLLQGPYYRVKIGPDLTIYMTGARLEELGSALLAAEPITSVNAGDATQKESSETAQPAAE